MPLCIQAINKHIYIQYKYNYKSANQLYTRNYKRNYKSKNLICRDFIMNLDNILNPLLLYVVISLLNVDIFSLFQ